MHRAVNCLPMLGDQGFHDDQSDFDIVPINLVPRIWLNVQIFMKFYPRLQISPYMSIGYRELSVEFLSILNTISSGRLLFSLVLSNLFFFIDFQQKCREQKEQVLFGYLQYPRLL